MTGKTGKWGTAHSLPPSGLYRIMFISHTERPCMPTLPYVFVILFLAVGKNHIKKVVAKPGVAGSPPARFSSRPFGRCVNIESPCRPGVGPLFRSLHSVSCSRIRGLFCVRCVCVVTCRVYAGHSSHGSLFCLYNARDVSGFYLTAVRDKWIRTVPLTLGDWKVRTSAVD